MESSNSPSRTSHNSGRAGQLLPVPSAPLQSNSAVVSHEASHVSMQPRAPRSLQGLLKYAMEATQAQDAPGNADLRMDEERRQFLEEALRSLTVNVTEVLDNAIKVLTNSVKMNDIKMEDQLPDEVKNSFTVLLDHVDNIDVANDFHKMGGFAMFPICYSSKNAEIRERASAVLGTLCQNNPYCQTRALECGLLHVLLNLVQTEQGHTLTKCLYAISCSTREFEPACRELIAQGGCSTLVAVLSAPEPAAKTKAAFLIRYFCQHYPEAKKQFIKQNIVMIIIAKIQENRDESTEHLLSILQVLVTSNDATVLKQCREPRSNLKNILENHLSRPELSDDRFTEEKEYCQDVLLHVFGSTVNNQAIR
ncbi:hsp70-binding protein 1 [Helicoverpa armigera]|uniref:hsp70-binding protein 1 n=1 Tax=Helicoverpa armigera TaxID=29058 RepID=UPI00308332EC